MAFVRKVPALLAPVVTPFARSIVMTCIASMISRLESLGSPLPALAWWLAARALSWIRTFPTLLVILLLIRGAVTRLVAPLGAAAEPRHVDGASR